MANPQQRRPVIQPKTGVRTGLRWRKPDSNRQYRVTEGFERDSCRLCLIRRQRKGDANESRCHDYGGVFRGTDGSNPAPSSEESVANLKLKAPVRHLVDRHEGAMRTVLVG